MITESAENCKERIKQKNDGNAFSSVRIDGKLDHVLDVRLLVHDGIS